MNIAITGEGIVSAIGLNRQEVLQSLLGGTTGIGEMKHLHSVHHELPVGEVPLSDSMMKEMLGLSADTMMSRTALLGMLAIGQALDDARVDKKHACADKPLRVALVSGTTVGGMDITERCFDALPESDDVEFLEHHDCGRSTLWMARHFGVFCEATTISTACSSAANAIMLGARLIEAGQADIVVAGGTEALSRFHLNGFNSLMILDSARCRPFDATRAGLNLGEGAAFVVLESAASASRRGIKPHAYLTGCGNACDAFHQTASSENGEGAYLAMKEALASAHLSANDIQYVNAHGTGTPNNDLSESVALKRIFGEKMPMVSSTKSFTGHTTSASGAIETVICILAMQHQFVPANLGWHEAMDGGIIPSMGARNVRLDNVLCNSFGFGGNDTSLVLSLMPGEDSHAKAEIEEAALAFGGNIADELHRLGIKVVSQMEITSEDQLTAIRNYVKPLEARRMGKIMKSALLSSLEVLEKAGMATPDAIVTGTEYGCLENSERLLEQIKAEGEVMLKPTLFMQSTHNTIGSSIAIKTQCHGYNITYTQEAHSLEWALRDAVMLLKSGKCGNVLVGCHDESTPLLNELRSKIGAQPLPSIRSIAMLLSCGE